MRRTTRSALIVVAALAFVALPIWGCGGGGGDSGTPAVTIPPGCGCNAPGAVGIPGTTPSVNGMTAAELSLVEEVFAQVNAERTNRILPPLVWHQLASHVAYDHSVYQEGIGAITHDGPGACVAPTDCLSDRLTAGGIAAGGGNRSAWGENVARGQVTAQDVMCGGFSWMLSAGHCANTLLPTFTHIGIAVKTGGAGGPYWTQVFLTIP
jgi:uncharacterized protein YkwD